MRISDWSSDVCSSDLNAGLAGAGGKATADFIVIDVPLPAFVNAFGARRFDPGALTILDDLQLHIVDHAGYGYDHSPHVARRRHLRSDERRVGKEVVSPIRYRWSTYY